MIENQVNMFIVPLARLNLLSGIISGKMPNLAGEKNVLCKAMANSAIITIGRLLNHNPTIANRAIGISDHLVTTLIRRLLYLSENCPAKPEKRINGMHKQIEAQACPPCPR